MLLRRGGVQGCVMINDGRIINKEKLKSLTEETDCLAPRSQKFSQSETSE